MKHKFGDVLRDNNDEEVVMAICDLKDGDWKVVLLVPYSTSGLVSGEITWRDLSTGLWGLVDG